MVSIIVPVYKVELYIHKCIDSILSQTFADFELLLIDDGSPDNCGRICDEYAEKDVRVHVFHQKNGGVSKARNLGLDYAKGEYICFVDSDDWIDSEMLETLIGWEQKKQTDLLFFGFKQESSTTCSDNIDVFRELSGIYEGVDAVIRACYLLERKELFGWTWNKLFRNSIIQEYSIRFDEEISFQEDHIFTLAYMRYVKCLAVYGYTPYHYMLLSDSLMRKIYPYLQCKKKALKLFSGRVELIEQVKSSNLMKLYKEFAVRQLLLMLLHSYRCSINDIDNRIIEAYFVRSMIRRYALVGQTMGTYTLYLFSYLPSVIFYAALRIYNFIKYVY